jgi:hypothetical protein
MQGWSGWPLGDWTDHFNVLKASIGASSFSQSQEDVIGPPIKFPGNRENNRNIAAAVPSPIEILLR